MSISSRIQAMGQHLEDDYSVLELAGADLTNVDKNIVNLKPTWKERLFYFMNNGTDVVWNNWDKVIGEGTSLSLNNTLEGKMKIDLKGNTSQEGTPTPETPQDIHVVSGDNSIKVEGKNLFDYNKITTSAQYTNNYDGTFTRNSNGTNVLINVNDASVPYDTFSLLAGTYSVSFDIKTTTTVTLTNFFMCTKQNDTTSNLAKSIGVQIPANTTTHIKAENYVVVNNAEKVGFAGYLSASTGVVISNIQVEKNSTATTYEPYQSQSYAVNLGSMELCKIGDYQDYIYKDNKKWYKYGVIDKVVLDGTQNITLANGTPRRFNATYTTLGIDNVKSGANATETQANYRMCDHFTYISGGSTWGNYYLHNNWLVMLDGESVMSDANALKTWLGNNNTSIYYVLETPETTEITDTTLISQLEALNGSKSYNPQTNVSQVNNDLPFILTTTALREMA